MTEFGVDDFVLSLTSFGRRLREEGLSIDADRIAIAIRAAVDLGVTDVASVYWAGRASFCSSPEQIRIYDELFATWRQSGVLVADEGGSAPVRSEDAAGQQPCAHRQPSRQSQSPSARRPRRPPQNQHGTH